MALFCEVEVGGHGQTHLIILQEWIFNCKQHV
jgi:hypothetical protein